MRIRILTLLRHYTRISRQDLHRILTCDDSELFDIVYDYIDDIAEVLRTRLPSGDITTSAERVAVIGVLMDVGLFKYTTDRHLAQSYPKFAAVIADIGGLAMQRAVAVERAAG